MRHDWSDFKERGKKSLFTCSALPFSCVIFSVWFLCPSLSTSPTRTSQLPGAPGGQPGGHEEQERGQPGCHPPGHEAFSVPAQLLWAGHNPGCLHLGCCPRPGASSLFLVVFLFFLPCFTQFKSSTSDWFPAGSPRGGPGLPLPRVRSLRAPLQPRQLARVDEGPPCQHYETGPLPGPLTHRGQQEEPEAAVERCQALLPVGGCELNCPVSDVHISDCAASEWFSSLSGPFLPPFPPLGDWHTAQRTLSLGQRESRQHPGLHLRRGDQAADEEGGWGGGLLGRQWVTVVMCFYYHKVVPNTKSVCSFGF